MKIRGLKYLRRNDYDTITINSRDKVNIYGRSNWPTMKLSHSISDELRKMTPEEKIDRITEYFLDYHPVTLIDENHYTDGNRFIYIGSNGEVTLKYGIQPSEKSTAMILNKYCRDRMQAFSECELDNYVFSAGNRAMYYADINGHMSFSLIYRDEKLIPMEVEFLRRVLPQLFGDNIVRLEKKYRKDRTGIEMLDLDGYFIVGCGRIIRIDSKIIELVQSIINEHNISIQRERQETEKVYQLKMEGF